jgi:hypothetical protein
MTTPAQGKRQREALETLDQKYLRRVALNLAALLNHDMTLENRVHAVALTRGLAKAIIPNAVSYDPNGYFQLERAEIEFLFDGTRQARPR